MPEQSVTDQDHVALSRLLVEIAWRIDHGQADRVSELFDLAGLDGRRGTDRARGTAS